MVYGHNLLKGEHNNYNASISLLYGETHSFLSIEKSYSSWCLTWKVNDSK